MNETKNNTTEWLREGLNKDIVAAWFSTVINPMIRVLRSQHDHLSRGNPTWRRSASTFEVLVRPTDFIDLPYLPNLEQVLDWYPALAELANVHGNAIEELRRRCVSAQEALEHSREVRSKLADAGDTLFESFERKSIDEIAAYVAQLIINSIGDLPDYYEGHAYWNTHRRDLASVVAKSDAATPLAAVRDASSRLLSRVDEYSQTLGDIRAALASQYGVPFAPPAQAA